MLNLDVLYKENLQELPKKFQSRNQGLNFESISLTLSVTIMECIGKPKQTCFFFFFRAIGACDLLANGVVCGPLILYHVPVESRSVVTGDRRKDVRAQSRMD